MTTKQIWGIVFVAALLTGCRQQSAPNTSKAVGADYTNSIAGEIQAQKNIADFAYAMGHGAGVMDEQKEQFRKNFGRELVTSVDFSKETMERQVEQIFWNKRTNAAPQYWTNYPPK